jgi:nucleoside-diphosphate-sugar epimerase
VKRVLVTGAAGFLGRHFVTKLSLRDDCERVTGVDVRGWPYHPGGDYEHLMQDVRDFFRTTHLRYDLVIHCAAVDPHRAAIDAANVNLSYNLQYDSMMFTWAVRTGTPVLYVSSSAVYPVCYQRAELSITAMPDRLHEDLVDLDADPLYPPDSVYGWTKWVGELQARQVARTGLPVYVVRPFSGYGVDQSENFPFRAFIERARRREDPFTIWGNAHQVRDWIHVSDVVNGALAVVDADHREPVNLCTGSGTTMNKVASYCVAAAGYDPIVVTDMDAPMGVMYRVGDPTRMLDIYEPKIEVFHIINTELAGGTQ